jgi:hypothetical protein
LLGKPLDHTFLQVSSSASKGLGYDIQNQHQTQAVLASSESNEKAEAQSGLDALEARI